MSTITQVKTNDNLQIYCEVHNPTATQTIIFAHGNGNSVQDWHTLGFVEKLAPYFRLILIDAIGYGNSDKPTNPERYTPEKRAEDVIAVLDALDIDQAHFFGNSIGGSLGFVLANLYPKRFKSFIIGSAHPYGSSEPNGCNLFPKEFRDLMAQGGMQAFVNIVEKQFLKKPFRAGVRERYLQNNPQAMIAANTPEWPNRSTCLGHINVPVLLYAGALDPVAELQSKIKEKIHSNVEIVILPDTDHADAYWQSEKTAPLIKRFIEKYS